MRRLYWLGIVALLANVFYAPLVSAESVNLAEMIENLAKTDTVNLAADDPDGNVRYIGASPDNYVLYNNELWRIIGVFDDRVKLMRAQSLGGYSWNSDVADVNYGSGANSWVISKIMQELNGDYLNIDLSEDPLWYSDKELGKENVFDRTKVLSGEAQAQIDDAVWQLSHPNKKDGAVINERSTELVAASIYAGERSGDTSKGCKTSTFCNDTAERPATWTGKVGLIYPSDYLYSSTGTGEITRNDCLAMSQYRWSTSPKPCAKGSWMFSGSSTWTISPAALGTHASNVFYVTYGGGIASSTDYVNFEILPVVYLKSSVVTYGGSGAQDDPYLLEPVKEPVVEGSAEEPSEEPAVEDEKKLEENEMSNTEPAVSVNESVIEVPKVPDTGARIRGEGVTIRTSVIVGPIVGGLFGLFVSKKRIKELFK